MPNHSLRIVFPIVTCIQFPEDCEFQDFQYLLENQGGLHLNTKGLHCLTLIKEDLMPWNLLFQACLSTDRYGFKPHPSWRPLWGAEENKKRETRLSAKMFTNSKLLALRVQELGLVFDLPSKLSILSLILTFTRLCPEAAKNESLGFPLRTPVV